MESRSKVNHVFIMSYHSSKGFLLRRFELAGCIALQADRGRGRVEAQECFFTFVAFWLRDKFAVSLYTPKPDYLCVLPILVLGEDSPITLLFMKLLMFPVITQDIMCFWYLMQFLYARQKFLSTFGLLFWFW